MRPTKNLVFVFLVIFFKEASSVCDKFALSSVDALVHKHKNSRAIVHRRENFNMLDNYLTVDVIASNVSQLCVGMIKNFPVLETLSFINANLTLIEPGAFQNVPNLKYISLSVNQLTTIPEGLFNPIKSLKVIYLTRNLIETIDDNAFSAMANLKAVHLDHNKITKLTGKIFVGSPILSLVDFSYNQLTDIERNAFEDLKTSSSVKVVNILLKKNQIANIDKETFTSLNAPVNLHLESNEISLVSNLVFSVKEYSEIYLANNKIECIPDDVVQLIKETYIKVDVKNNPIQCVCVERADLSLVNDVRGELNIITTLPCSSNFPF